MLFLLTIVKVIKLINNESAAVIVYTCQSQMNSFLLTFTNCTNVQKKAHENKSLFTFVKCFSQAKKKISADFVFQRRKSAKQQRSTNIKCAHSKH